MAQVGENGGKGSIVNRNVRPMNVKNGDKLYSRTAFRYCMEG